MATLRFLLSSLFILSCAFDVLAEPVKIVAILPLSGRLAPIGKDLRQAVSLQSFGAVSLHYEDDGFDPKSTASAVQKSLLDPHVKGFILFGSGTSLAAKPLIERAGLPAISVAMTDKITQNSKSVFRYYIPGLAQAERIIEEIGVRGYKNVTFVTSQQEAMLGIEDFFKSSLKVAPDRYIDVVPGELDVRGIALKVITMKPDAVCLLLIPPELPAFAKLLRGLGFKGDFFGPTQLGNPDAITAADGALENAWFTGVNETNAKEFIEQYRTRFGTVPTSEAIAAHDAAGLLAAAVVTQDPIKFLHSPHNFRGIFGRELAVVEPNTFQPPLALKRVVKSALVQESPKRS